ncbi:MAG: D-aminoacylase [Clostridia bacterium]|nr:D-aminoacylase [Clostridia bacterium]
MYDIIIRGARVLDGTGNPAFHADVAVKDGKIARVGPHFSGAERIIDAAGQVLAPGFINVHSHQDMALERDPLCACELEQGITTFVGGMCGESPAPISEKYEEAGLRAAGGGAISHESLAARRDMGAYFRFLNRPCGVNTAFLTGHGNLRAAVSGYADRKLTAAELEEMKSLLRRCMKAGALGVSFGLIYPPGSYADTDELIQVARVAAELGGVFTVHMRSENSGLIEATDEMLRVAKASGARCVISHHKATGGRLNWNKTAATLSMMQRAADEGLDIFCDQYPYTASSTGLDTNIPGPLHALGTDELVRRLTDPAGRAALRPAICGNKSSRERFSFTMIGNCRTHPEYNGRMLNDIADELGVDPYDLHCGLLAENRLNVTGIFHSMCEEDVERVMRWDRAMFGTDGASRAAGKIGHPRIYASFPRILGRYVRERRVITLENAIRKMCCLPAMVYGFHTKGLIREGMDADLVIFDPETIIDRATYAHPELDNEGISYVMVNGRIAVEDGKATGVLAGRRLLRRHD